MQDNINTSIIPNESRLDKAITKFVCTVKRSKLIEKLYKCPYCQDSRFLPYLIEETAVEHVARCYCMEDHKIDEYNRAINDKIIHGVDPETEKAFKYKIRYNESFKKFVMYSQIKNCSEERFNKDHYEYLILRDRDGNKLYPRGYLDYYLQYKFNFFKKIRTKEVNK